MNNPRASTTPLAAELAGRIRGHGPLPLAGFMARCLYDTHLGYYTRGLNFVANAQGRDFLTAPTLTPLFGATLARWVAARWQELGQPNPFHLVEAGPGNGALMEALLNELQTTAPACHTTAQVHLVEVSPALTQLQQQRLGTRATWHTGLHSLPQNAPTILLANEVLDAFPTDVFLHRENEWHQMVITNPEADTLTPDIRPRRLPPPLPAGWQPAAEARLEVSTSQLAWLTALKEHLHTTTGHALLIDYGYVTLPPQGGDTLQALHQHQPVAITHLPGETDLTTHVNFGWAVQVLENDGTGTCRLTDLTPFLLENGLLSLAEGTITQEATQAALHRLLHPSQMGSLFKVLAFSTL